MGNALNTDRAVEISNKSTEVDVRSDLKVLAWERLWIQLALAMAPRPQQQPVQFDNLTAQWSGQSTANRLVAGVRESLREEGERGG